MSKAQEPYQPVQPVFRPRQQGAGQQFVGPPGTPGQYDADPESGAPAQYGVPGQPATPPQPGNPPHHAAPGQHGAPGQPGAPGQHSSDGPFGLPGQQPPARNHRKLWTVLGIAGGVLVLAAVGLVILLNVLNGAANHARGLADAFTKLVIAGDTSTAYDDYLDPALKEQLTKEDFIAGVKTLEMDSSCKPAYHDVKARTETGAKSADVAGLITCDGDKKIDLVYRFEGADELKMVNIKLKPQA